MPELTPAQRREALDQINKNPKLKAEFERHMAIARARRHALTEKVLADMVRTGQIETKIDASGEVCYRWIGK
jgi:hypothetical protein